jgi:ABC-type polysaccharide/polyol phosphate export permease
MLGIWQHGFLLESLVLREIRVRYRRSVLGVVWTLLNPLMMMIIFTVVFSTLFAGSLQHFPVYFLTAFLSWQFFARATSEAMTALVRSAALFKRIAVPKYIFIVAVVCTDLINFLLALIPLAGLIILIGQPIRPTVLFLPISIVVLTAFTIGVSFFIATITVFFDDMTQFYAVVLQAGMYISAIFYPIDIVPQKFRILIALNPMYYCIQMVRLPIYNGQIPDALTLIAAVLSAVVALAVGGYVFARYSDRFIYYV